MMNEKDGWFWRAPGLKNMWSSGYGSLALGSGSNGDLMALEVEGIQHSRQIFTAG
jgi:hypothetical protein